MARRVWGHLSEHAIPEQYMPRLSPAHLFEVHLVFFCPFHCRRKLNGHLQGILFWKRPQNEECPTRIRRGEVVLHVRLLVDGQNDPQCYLSGHCISFSCGELMHCLTQEEYGQ